MDLTQEEKTIVCNLLSQVSVPIKDAHIVIAIINKLQQPQAIVKEDKK